MKFTKHISEEDKRIKHYDAMIIIASMCFVVLFLIVCIGYFVQEMQEDKVEDLPTEVVAPSIAEEFSLMSIEKETETEDENEDDPKYHVEAQEPDENTLEERIARAKRLDNVRITYYCAEKYHHICNAGAPYKTRNGNDVVPGFTCAVDPRVIPLGSTVFVDFGDGVIHEYYADDTGGAIKGKRVDLTVETHQYALERGVDRATIWWIKE